MALNPVFAVCALILLPLALLVPLSASPKMPSSIQVAQAVGITTSAFLAGISEGLTMLQILLIWKLGACTCITVLGVPPLMLAPSPLVARQWKKVYDLGVVRSPPLALTSALSFSFLSYKLYGTLNQPKAELYALSALLTIGIVPYTLLAMLPTNNKLMRNAEEAEAMTPEEQIMEVKDSERRSTKQLLDLWATHNLVRGMFPLAGSVLGLWTAVRS